MNVKEFIQAKQQAWAKRHGLQLAGSKLPDEGEKNYVDNISYNLFEPLSKESLKSFEKGDGNETKDTEKYRAKMKALHSSSALAVNVFQYWQNKDVYPILYTCRLCAKRQGVATSKGEVIFEQKFEISDNKKEFPHSPNLDVVIREDGNKMVYAIESKFTEPYAKHDGLREAYLKHDEFWEGLPELHKLAKKLCHKNKEYCHLDAAQLIKHVLGLKAQHHKSGFRLLYIWYDVPGEASCQHRKEIADFADVLKADHIHFHHITYQEVINKLAQDFRSGNEAYIDYLKDRYL